MTYYKRIRFDMLAVGEKFYTDALVGEGTVRFVKTSTRKASMEAQTAEFAMKPSDLVTVVDQQRIDSEAAFLARPLFDGTEASCKSRADFYALDAALRGVVIATETLDKMADYVIRKMQDVKHNLRRNATEQEQKDRFTPRFAILPCEAVAYSGLNSCGELQGNGNVDMLVATLIAKREAFASLVRALGYRTTDNAAKETSL